MKQINLRSQNLHKANDISSVFGSSERIDMNLRDVIDLKTMKISMTLVYPQEFMKHWPTVSNCYVIDE